MSQLKSLLIHDKGALLVAASQLMAAVLHVCAKLLATGPRSLHPLQILNVRMIVTVVSGSFYLWQKRVADFPLGPRELRPLLIARALGGVCGSIGFYTSLMYLSLADATALNFVAPLLACCITTIILGGAVSMVEMLGAATCIIGILFIARPGLVFHETVMASSHFVKGLCFALVGVIGGAVAYSTLRVIGKRTHPIVSINYFGVFLIIFSAAGMVVLPDAGFKTDLRWREWSLLAGVAISGFAMEVLMTSGLSQDSSSRATTMIYTQAFWAMVLDLILFDSMPRWTAILGIIMIITGVTTVTFATEMPQDSENVQYEQIDMREALPVHASTTRL